jgi:hypothetical protein
VFVVVVAVAGLGVVFAGELAPGKVQWRWPSKVVVGLLAAVILANAAAVFVQEGLHWTLPDNPERYQLLDYLGIFRV